MAISKPSPQETMMMADEEKEIHLFFMREALAMAELALNTNETPVGCVFVHKNSIIGRGMNATNRTYNGTRHAEFMAISSILSQTSPSGEKMYSPEVLWDCDLYVTVEPCIMCASLLRQMGVRKVYFGAGNEKFGGTGGVLNIHKANGMPLNTGDEKEESGEAVVGSEEREEGDYEVSGGWLRDEAILMLQRFYMQANERAPEAKNRTPKGAVLDELADKVPGRAGNG